MAAFVVYSLAQAVAVLSAAAEMERPVTVLSPPDGARSMGPLFFRALIDSARAAVPEAAVTAILDCGDAPGLAMAALRCGVTALRLEAPPETMRRVSAIAADQGAILMPAGTDGAVLDLDTCPDPLAAVLAMLRAAP